MNVPETQSNMLSKCMQGGLLLTAPCILAAAGGPQAIWQNHGWIVRTIFLINATPAAVCSLALAEDAIRAIDIFVKDIFAGKNYRKDPELHHEIARVAGFARAVAFPINGWGVLVKLPISDHYVYAKPVKAATVVGKKLGHAALKTLFHIDKFMERYGLYKVLELAYKITIKPAFKVVKVVVVGAATVIGSALGFARDLIFKS